MAKTSEEKNNERFERYHNGNVSEAARMTNRELGLSKKKKLYNHKFEELFDSKQQAVTSFLSLERRNLELHHQYREFRKQVALDYDSKPESQCKYKYTPYKPVGE